MAQAMPSRLLVCISLVVLALAFGPWAGSAAPDGATSPGMTIAADVNVEAPLRTTSARWLSVNIDGSQVVEFPYSDPILRVMAQELGGRSYLRVGGTTSDTAYYAMSGTPPTTPPPGYKIVVTADTVDALCGFAAGAGMKVIFGLNAGKGPRNNSATGAWDPSNAKTLLEYVHSHHPGCVEGWELGNEPNLWLFNFGLIISTQQLVNDYRTLKGVIAGINPEWLLIGNDCAFQIPIVGELFPTYTDWMSEGGGALVDVVTWHWYPLEGPACPLGGFPVQATPERVITPHTLSMDAQYRQTVLQYAAKYGNNTRVWLGEMAAASCGGADNVTDAWSGAFYYLHMLGSLGEDGHDAVMRQSLWSSEYGLIVDNGSHFANPDYWSAILWTRLMDSRVVSVGITPAVVPESSLYRVFARCTLNAKSEGNSSKALFPDAAGGVTVLVLNLAPTSPLTVTSFGVLSTSSSQRQEFIGTSGASSSELNDVLTSHYVSLNGGSPLVRGATGATPTLPPRAVDAGAALELPPLSYAFVVFDKAAAAACA